jgi:hypothetical protein
MDNYYRVHLPTIDRVLLVKVWTREEAVQLVAGLIWGKRPVPPDGLGEILRLDEPEDLKEVYLLLDPKAGRAKLEGLIKDIRHQLLDSGEIHRRCECGRPYAKSEFEQLASRMERHPWGTFELRECNLCGTTMSTLVGQGSLDDVD